MRSLQTRAGIVVLLLLMNQSYAGTDVIEAPNFKGRNICLMIAGEADVQMQTQLGRTRTEFSRPASYSITLPGAGTVSVREQIDVTDSCKSLPVDRFAWHDRVDGQRSESEFCLSPPPAVASARNVHVQISANSNIGRLDRLKTAIYGVAACRMLLYPSQYDSEDKYSNRAPLLQGPYALSYTAK